MYHVIFHRRDDGLEIYDYHNLEDAQYHFSLFGKEDADLYKEILLTADDKPIPLETLYLG